jgi:hypothetical protein
VGAFTPVSFRFQGERREETVAVMMLTGGSHLSAREEREGGTGSGSVESGPWARSGAGLDHFPGALFYFYFLCSFSNSVFIISFIHISNLIQTRSNQFVKFSKN